MKLCRPARGIRCERHSNGVGVTAYARWEAMVAPPPVEDESDFRARLDATRLFPPRFGAIAAITAALAGIALADHIQWL